jgi:hypothetical protein
MVDDEGRHADRALDEGPQRYLLAGRRVDVDVVERLWPELELGTDLKHHMILVERRIHG